MKELLVLLGKRVHDLRAAKGWSQEEFAHVCGLHRTYIGQVERAEKNISFGNLVKLASALGMTLPELFAGLEGPSSRREGGRASRGAAGTTHRELRLFEIQKLLKQLSHQRRVMDRTLDALEDIARDSGKSTSSIRRPKK